MKTSFIANVNKLVKNLDKIFSSIAEIISVKTSVETTKEEVKDLSTIVKENQVETEKLVDKAEQILKDNQALMLDTATEYKYGLVKLASTEDITNKLDSKVVQARHLGQTIERFAALTDEATTGKLGIVRKATETEVANGVTGGVVTSDLLKYYKVNLDLQGFFTVGRTDDNIVYTKATLTTDYTVLDMYGKAFTTPDKLDIRIEFANPILPSELGFSAIVESEIGVDTKKDVIITDSTERYIDVAVVDNNNNKVAGTFLFIIKATLDTANLPPKPVNITSEANGKTVTLKWDI